MKMNSLKMSGKPIGKGKVSGVKVPINLKG